MDVVYKYEIGPHNWQITMPKGAQVLSAGVQERSVFIWALVDKECSATEVRTFHAYPTGALMNDGQHVFIDTVFMDWMVFHVFEIK